MVWWLPLRSILGIDYTTFVPIPSFDLEFFTYCFGR